MVQANQTFTDDQLLAIARQEYARCLQALSLGKGDRQLVRNRISDLREEIIYLEERVAAANGQSSDGGTAYAAFVPPR